MHGNARPPERAATAAVAAGLLIVVAFALLDAALGQSDVVATSVVVGPLVTAAFAPARLTAIVSVAAVAAAVASGLWNHDFGQEGYVIRGGAVAVGSAFAVAGADVRERLRVARRRFALLLRLAELSERALTLDETVAAIIDILVPTFADAASIDLDPAKEPPPERQSPTSLTVPLRTRGHGLGTLLLQSENDTGRGFGPQDLAFTKLLSGRVALALDNAGLVAELETLDAQLSAALGSLSDAVTVQTPQGRLLYANTAAADSMGFASPEDLLATPPADIVDHYDTFGEDGAPLTMDDLPGRRVMAGDLSPPPLLVRSVHRDTGHERWTVVKSTGVLDRDGAPRLAVNVIEDVTEAKRAELSQRLLVRAGEALASSLDYERTLQQIAELAVPALADWCGVSLPDRHGRVQQVAVAHVDPEKVRFARELADRYPTHVDDPGGAAEVLREGVSQLVNDITPEMLREGTVDEEHYRLLAGIGMRAAMVVPLTVGGRSLGTLTLVSAESQRSFMEEDLELAEELARRAGTAVQNARLYTERSSIAATLQAGLLPQPLPAMPGWTTATLYKPAGSENSVGGDFYDAFRVSDGWMVVVGDVAGRGAPAAAVTALARYTLRTAAQLLPDPLAAVERLNEELYLRTGNALCSVACAVLRGREATVLCAGHPPPFLLAAGRARQVGEAGPMLGAIRTAAWPPVTLAVEAGATLVLYTDGVIDTVGEDGRFGEERLAAALTGAHGPAAAVAAVEDALAAFQRGEQADDTAAVAVGRPA